MKSKTNSKIFVLLTFGIVIALSTVHFCNLYFTLRTSDNDNAINFDNQNLKISKISGKIHIDNNWSAALIAGICTGSGGYSDPYVIEDLIIDAGGAGSGIWVQDTTEFFKIENCTVYNSGNDWSDAGILLGANVDNGQLIDNIIYNNSVGIFLASCNNCTISGNTISNSNLEGMRIWYCNNNTISDNYVQGNENGMHYNECNDNNITGNIANNNGNTGIVLANCTYHIVSGNNASINGQIGIWMASSVNVIISDNYLTGNGFANGWEDSADNYWDNGVLGNYWGDYTGKDADDDGIGDTPYLIPGAELSYDNFPIWWDAPIVSIIAPIADATFKSSAPEYSISVEGVPITMWYTIDGVSGTFSITNLTGTIDQDTWNALEEGDVTITFYVQDSEDEIGSDSIIIKKSIPDDIPGYNLYIMLGIISAIAIIITKKVKKL